MKTRWITPHHGASVSWPKAPVRASQRLSHMLLVVFAGWAYTIAVALARCRTLILDRERHTEWVADILRNDPNSRQPRWEGQP